MPEAAGGRRIVGAYTYGSAIAAPGTAAPEPAPAGTFWQVITEIADRHRGEAVVFYAQKEELDARDLCGVTLSVDSHGPIRIDPGELVDNGF